MDRHCEEHLTIVDYRSSAYFENSNETIVIGRRREMKLEEGDHVALGSRRVSGWIGGVEIGSCGCCCFW